MNDNADENFSPPPNTGSASTVALEAGTVAELIDALSRMDGRAEVIGCRLGRILVVPQQDGEILITDRRP